MFSYYTPPPIPLPYYGLFQYARDDIYTLQINTDSGVNPVSLSYEPCHEKSCFLLLAYGKTKALISCARPHASDQCLCFRYIDGIFRHFKPLAIFCGCTARFVSDLF